MKFRGTRSWPSARGDRARHGDWSSRHPPPTSGRGILSTWGAAAAPRPRFKKDIVMKRRQDTSSSRACKGVGRGRRRLGGTRLEAAEGRTKLVWYTCSCCPALRRSGQAVRGGTGHRSRSIARAPRHHQRVCRSAAPASRPPTWSTADAALHGAKDKKLLTSTGPAAPTSSPTAKDGTASLRPRATVNVIMYNTVGASSEAPKT